MTPSTRTLKPRASWWFVMALVLASLPAAASAVPTREPVDLFVSQLAADCGAAPVLTDTSVPAAARCGPLVALDSATVARTAHGYSLRLDALTPISGTVALMPYDQVTVAGMGLRVGASVTEALVTVQGTDSATGATYDLGSDRVSRLATPLDGVSAMPFQINLPPGLDGTVLRQLKLTITLEGLTAADWYLAADGQTSMVMPTQRLDDGATPVTCRGLDATIIGTDGDDVLTGTPGRDVIVGQGGDDRIDGLEGDDVLCGGDGDDVISGGPGDDTISGGVGDDLLSGDAGDDFIEGGNSQDMILGGEGSDTLRGGNGDDRIDGGAGDDHLVGHAGSDDLFGGPGNDFIRGGHEGDQLVGGDGDDRLIGDGHADILRGGPGRDLLDAGDGDDQLDGGAGDDDLIGGEGEDVGTGGEDADRCVEVEIATDCEY